MHIAPSAPESCNHSPQSMASGLITKAAIALVLLYAAAAGYRTLADPDLPWQLRDARYLVETGHSAAQDVFSYTVPGRSWIYPQGAGLIFYGLYRLGGYAALSWLSVFACAATAGALLVIRPGLLSAAMVALAVPLIAWRTCVRADLFTTFLFALSLLLLLRGIAQRHPWVLALVMAFWVNLHTAFVLGLVLIGVFLLEQIVMGRAAGRARMPVPTLAIAGALAVLATLLNPFGAKVWLILSRQGEGTPFYRAAVSEWGPSIWSRWRLQELLRWREPDGAYWVLLFISVAALVAAAGKKRWALAALLAVFAGASLYSLRFQALFGVVAVATVAELAPNINIRPRVRFAGLLALALMIAVRVSDLASNHFYFSHAESATFGAGLSPAFPERAAEFILRERLPGRLLHEYDLGGYLSWKLGRSYPIFVDGRTLPFGAGLMLENIRAFSLRPASPEWRAFMDRWGIQTVFLNLERHRVYGPALRGLCGSSELRLVYLDDVAAVFLRNTAENQPWLDRLGKSCQEAAIPSPPQGEPPYFYHAQSAKVYHQIGRVEEAWAELQQARRYFDADPDLHVDAGQLLSTWNPDQARREFLAGTAYGENSRAWFLLGKFEASTGRHREAIGAYLRATRNQEHPYEAYRGMAKSYLELGEPIEALRWFGRALGAQNSLRAREALGPNFLADAYAGQARARFMMGDTAGAESALLTAVRTDPGDPNLQLMLSEFYLGQGQLAEARAALARAESLGANGPAFTALRQRLQGN